MSACELANAHGLLSRQPFNVVIRSCHHAVLVVVDRAVEVLDDIRRQSHLFQRLAFVLMVQRSLSVTPVAWERQQVDIILDLITASYFPAQKVDFREKSRS
jgi:hypothetical protein